MELACSELTKYTSIFKDFTFVHLSLQLTTENRSRAPIYKHGVLQKMVKESKVHLPDTTSAMIKGTDTKELYKM